MAWIAPPPGSPSPAAPSPDVIVRGSALVVPLNFEFPPVCIVTGKTDDLVKLRRTVTWHPSAIYLTILINLVVYLIVALCVRKTSHHTIYLARTERARRTRWQIVAWVAFTAGLAAIPLAISMDVVDVFWATPICLIIAAIIYFIHGRLIHAERISDSTVAIRGVAPTVMAQLADASRRKGQPPAGNVTAALPHRHHFRAVGRDGE